MSSRITSLYWFNLSLESLLEFPDLWEPITRVGREVRMLEPYFLEGDAYAFDRCKTDDGRPDWDLSTVASPDTAVLFALDTAYRPHPEEHVFVFDDPRPVRFSFRMPAWLHSPADVFRVDAHGIHEVIWHPTPEGVAIEDIRSRDGIYVATRSKRSRSEIERLRQAALSHEALNTPDPEALRRIRN